jgi:hypothetical protein
MTELSWPTLVERAFQQTPDDSQDDIEYGNPEVIDKWHTATLDSEAFTFRGSQSLDEPTPHGLKFKRDTSVDIYAVPVQSLQKMEEALQKLAVTFANLSGKGNTFKAVANLPGELGKWAIGWKPNDKHKDLFLQSPKATIQVYESSEGTLYLSHGEGLLMAYFISVFEDVPMEGDAIPANFR